MTIVKQLIVTNIGELSALIQDAHLQYGDNHSTKIIISIDEKGKCVLCSPSDFLTNTMQPVNDEHGH
jgi:hypothetical protein